MQIQSVEKGYITSEQRDFVQQNLTYTTELQEAVRSADLVIEAILEIMELKIETFKKVEEFAPATCDFGNKHINDESD